MGAEATLRPGRLAVAPSDEAAAEIVVKNTGLVVDSFALSVLGPAAAWACCEPDALSLFPGQEGTARVIMHPPVLPGLHGPVPFGVRVASGEDPPGSVVEEGVLDVAPLALVSTDMSPRTGRSRGMGASRHRVAVDNRGNAPAFVSLAGGDDADTAHVQVKPTELEVPPGSAAFADIRVRGRRRFWRGTPVTHRFHVTAYPPDESPVTSEGTLVQEAALPRWLPRAIAFTVAGAVAAAALWFGLLRPTVRDAATSAGTAAAQRAVNAALSTSATPAQAGTASTGGAKQGSAPTPKPGPKPTPPPKSGKSKAGSAAPTPSPTPIATPPAASGAAKPGSAASTAKASRPAAAPFAQMLDSGNPAITAAARHTLAITDLVLMNPAGDQGVLTLTRSGQVLFSMQLADFREYDLHFITAITVTAGKDFRLSVNCQNPGGKACTPDVMISGTNAG